MPEINRHKTGQIISRIVSISISMRSPLQYANVCQDLQKSYTGYRKMNDPVFNPTDLFIIGQTKL